MNFETGHLYHVYNQGNNRQNIFFKEENYLFFIEKIRTHILPFADVLAWCLMPNHFHLMLHPTHQVTPSDLSRSATISRGATMSRTPTNNAPTSKSFNHSIGVMLASYTRAIHKQENISGSLFRQKTKAICLTKKDTLSPSYFNTSFGTLININTPQSRYPKICFDYIHDNPVKAKLVKLAQNWKFSSIHEINGNGVFELVNLEMVKVFDFHSYLSDDSSPLLIR